MTTIAHNFIVADLCAAAESGDMPHLREILDAQPQAARALLAAGAEVNVLENYSCNIPRSDGPSAMAMVK